LNDKVNLYLHYRRLLAQRMPKSSNVLPHTMNKLTPPSWNFVLVLNAVEQNIVGVKILNIIIDTCSVFIQEKRYTSSWTLIQCNCNKLVIILSIRLVSFECQVKKKCHISIYI
jgi:hypothetical protein